MTLIGAQYVLFGQSIEKLGTEEHISRYLADAQSGKISGCFALTELGHGSNVRGILTTATYDETAAEFVINTPNTLAQKYWIGAGCSMDSCFVLLFPVFWTHPSFKGSRMTICWARLILRGRDYGIHAFLIHLRDAQGRALPGVSIKDCGHKMGINGVDNGRFWFDNYRVPKNALLNRYGDVSSGGEYVSPTKDADSRFALSMSEYLEFSLPLFAGSDPRLRQACSLMVASTFVARVLRLPKWLSPQPFGTRSPEGSLGHPEDQRCPS